MKILDSVLSLEQMEDILEKELERQKHSIRIFGDLDLSYEDYKCLSLKFRGIYRYPGSIEILENFKLSLLTAWIFSLRYEKEEISYYNIKKVLLKLPQYMQRKFISMCSETFEEYQYIEELVLEELVQAIRSIFLDCYFYELSIPKLLKKYPVISKKIIESCSVWCREWKRQNKMQVK